MRQALTYVELFAGAGGLSHGLDAAGWTCLAHSEIEPHARAVLRYRWPDVPLHGDVSALDGTQWRGVTLLSGGSPCQDLSIAGKRAGMVEGSGTRSSLFFDQVRLWHECQAPYCLWENVLGALSSNAGRDFAAVLSAFVGGAVPVPADGWRGAGVVRGPTGVAAWRVLDLRGFGVPQRRRRVFVLAARAGGVDPAQVLLELEGDGGHRAQGGDTGQAHPGAAGVGAGSGDSGQVDAVAMDGEYNVRVGVMGSLNIGSSSGSGRQPAVLQPTDAVAIPIQEVTSRQGAPHGSGVGIGAPGDPMYTLTSKQHGVLQPTDAVTAFKTRGGVEPEVFTLGTSPDQYISAPDALAVNISDGAVRVSEEMGTLGARSGGQEVGAQTRGVVVTFDARGNGDGSTCNTLAGDHQNRVTDYTALVVGGSGPLPNHPRRLLPVECERLMSWEDGATATGIDEQGREYQLRDTPRYKLCGNGVASIVAAWIGLRLADAITQLEAGR